MGVVVCGFPVLQESVLAASDGECRNRLGILSLLLQIPKTIVSVGFALAVAVYTLAGPAKTSAQPRALPFESVQTDLFSVPNSYSNAWADFDKDGDLDLAVSLGSGEVRLYRNDNGTLVNVGKEMGLPQADRKSTRLNSSH